MKALILLNEPTPGDHINVHQALSSMKSEQVIDDYYVYPFLHHLNKGLTYEQVIQEILGIAEKYEPNIILWSHTAALELNPRNYFRLKNLPSAPAIGYWDGDIYQKPQPVHKNVIQLASLCDAIFIQGFGDFSQSLKQAGAKDIHFVPASSDPHRFFKLRTEEQKPLYDVVMIGNNVTSLLPWRTAPGSKLRKKLTKVFYKNLKDRFAVFGYGWKQKFGKGPIPFSKQVETYHTSRVILGTNNWLGPKYYFSNRLPIALSSGIPVVYNYEEGFEEIFRGVKGLYFFKKPQEAWEICSDLLNKPAEELNKEARQGFQFARQNLTTSHILKYMLETLKKYHNNGVSPEDHIINPWLNEKIII